MSRKKAILFIFGDGGHKEQAKRLLSVLKLKEEFPDLTLVSLSEKNQIIFGHFHKTYFAPELRPKFKSGFNPFIILTNTLKQFSAILNIIFKFKIVVSISTGPGISIIPTYTMKLFQIPNIYLETWSRFETKSLAGKFMYHVSSLFLVQNKELKTLYTKALYSGRL